jgi:hypothetical protein
VQAPIAVVLWKILAWVRRCDIIESVSGFVAAQRAGRRADPYLYFMNSGRSASLPYSSVAAFRVDFA